MTRAVVVGAGIAGASVAYFLGRLGWAVTVVDAGEHAASHVPSALVNPVRGQSGGVDARAVAGMAATWALVAEVEAAGLSVPHGRTGILRPLPDDRARARFERKLPADLPHRWLDRAEWPAELEGDWAHALLLPDGGWVAGPALCAALVVLAGTEVVRSRAETITDTAVTLSDGQRLTADVVVTCGGSVGSTWAGETGTHRMGSMLRLDRAVTARPLSFGAYLAPDGAGGTLGGTFETPSPVWEPPRLPLASLRWLLGKGEALADLRGVGVRGVWTGSRLSGLRCGRRPDGVWELTGLSSKGFLLGPLLARELSHEIGRPSRGQ
ncbi:NAD(P)/FAD-dependent oxidoreductase [Deinococcus ficus]|uniref:NAD(P)/FAD-dependent oxidoreductase n=1 Tax=Deinococcus ficus TaxID=317577 RepID=UPI001FD18C64|nr:FAD-dependent oxidoreductase [Deinococcus ficus]